jgi:hypothetical protein
MARSLVDTNILIYSRDLGEPERRLRAIELIDDLAARGELVLTVQCLNEFSAASLRRGVDVSEVETAVTRWRDLGEVLPLEVAATTAALVAVAQHRLSEAGVDVEADEITEERDSMNVRRVIPLFVGVVAVATAAVLVTSATTLVTAHTAAVGMQGAGAPPSPGSLTPARIGEFGLDLAAMDRSVAPGDDFYRYVSGGWLRNTQIRGDVPRFAEFGRLPS